MSERDEAARVVRSAEWHLNDACSVLTDAQASADDWKAVARILAGRIAMTDSEITRLRAALEWIEGACSANHRCACGRYTGVSAAQHHARAALEGAKP